MIKITTLLAFFVFSVFFYVRGQLADNSYQNNVVAELAEINNTPVIVPFENRLKIANKGGHLQGIQALNHKGQTYYIVSGKIGRASCRERVYPRV